MGLPNSRDLTLDGSTPIPSSLINKLQDCVVGGKHPEFEHGMHGSGFQPTGASTYNGSLWNVAAGGDTFYMPIDVRVGDTITHVQGGYLRGTVASQISTALVRKPLNGGAAATIASVLDNTADGAFHVADVANINHVVESGYGYALYVTFDANAATNGAKHVGGAWFSSNT